MNYFTVKLSTGSTYKNAFENGIRLSPERFHDSSSAFGIIMFLMDLKTLLSGNEMLKQIYL